MKKEDYRVLYRLVIAAKHLKLADINALRQIVSAWELADIFDYQDHVVQMLDELQAKTWNKPIEDQKDYS